MILRLLLRKDKNLSVERKNVVLDKSVEDDKSSVKESVVMKDNVAVGNKRGVRHIVVDLGHGGMTKDGVYTTAPAKMHDFKNGEIAYEGVINRQIGELLYHSLSAIEGVNVHLTVSYNDPTDVSLKDRVSFTNRFKPSETIFISIHCNAYNGNARGFEIFTTKGQNKSDILAEHIAEQVEVLYDELKLPMRYDRSRDGDRDKESDFYVLRNVKCVATLLEVLFFDNKEDYKFLKDVSFRRRFVSAVTKGVRNYLFK